MALDLTNDNAIYTAMFKGKTSQEQRTLVEVWAAVSDIVKADPAFTVEKEAVEGRRLTLQAASGNFKLTPSTTPGRLNLNTSVHGGYSEEGVTAATAADFLVEYIQRNKSISKTSGPGQSLGH